MKMFRTLAVATLAMASLLSTLPAQASEQPVNSGAISVDSTGAERTVEPAEIPSELSMAARVYNGSGFNCETSPNNARSPQRIWNGAAGVFQDGSTNLRSSDILVLGDSQVWSHSWVAQGIRMAGYNPVMYRCGGIGAQAWRPGYSGDYYGGVVKNEWDLPAGRPRAIYIQGSGNDSYNDRTRGTAAQRYDEIVAKLRLLYPNTQIIMTGPLSRDQAWRLTFNDVLSAKARQLGVTYIPYKRWVSDFSLQSALADDVHFKDQEQWRLARPMASSLQAALRGYTLMGGIETYIGDHGGSARFGVPTSNETLSAFGGVWQTFSANHAAYWSPQTGTHSVWFSGAVGQDFRSHQHEWTSGYPIEDETAYSYGARQSFQKPDGAQTRFYWAPNTGSWRMNGRGAIFNTWVAGGHASNYGFPATDELGFGSAGAVQYFRHRSGAETGIFWSPWYGTHSMNSRGGIYHMYLNSGGAHRLGYPTSSESWNGSYASVKFSGGKEIRWTPHRGTYMVG